MSDKVVKINTVDLERAAAYSKADRKKWADIAKMSYGVESKAALEQLEGYEKSVKAAAAAKVLGVSLAKTNVAKGLTEFAKTAHEAGLGQISVKFDAESGKATFVVGSAKTSKGKKAGSCMSAREAWNFAVGKKCALVLAADFEKDVVEVAKATQGLSQRGVLFRDFNASEAVAKLRKYGYDS